MAAVLSAAFMLFVSSCSVDSGSDDDKPKQEIPADNPSGVPGDNPSNVDSKFTVTFKNGEEVFSSSEVKSGEKVSVPETNPSKDYYDFLGWRAAGAESDFDFNSQIKGDLVLLARFEKHTYTFSFDLNGGEGDAPVSITGKIGDTVELPDFESKTKPSTDGKTFTAVGWSTNAQETESGFSGNYTVDSAAITAGKFYLVWTDKNVWTVSFKNGGEVVYTSKVVDGGKITAPSAPEKTGYTFDGWKNFDAESAVNANADYEAEWKLVRYNITYTDEKNGVLQNGDTNPDFYTVESEEINFASPSIDGYNFTGWYDSNNLKVEKIEKASRTEDLTLTAKWELTEYSITYILEDSVNTNTDSNVTNPNTTVKYTVESEAVMLKDASSTRYNFLGWYKEGSKVTSIPNGSTGNLTLNAKWEAVAVTGITLNQTSLKISKGGEKTLTATVLPANATDKTVTWTAEGNATVDENGKVTASSAVGNATVTASAGGFSASCSIEVVDGISVEIVKSEGWLNSAYVIFKQVDGVEKYTVKVDGNAIDEPLIRFYDTYKYNEQSEDANLQVSWTQKTYSKVVRADALGLTAGTHTITVTPVIDGGVAAEETVTVRSHDRTGFGFTGTTTPGAYKADGTLKDNAIVIYVTGATAKTVSYDAVSGKNSGKTATYKGLQNILSEASLKNLKVPIDIRIIGTIEAEQVDSFGSAAEGIQIKTTSANGVTVEGVGHDAVVHGFGFLIRNAKYTELSNLGVFYFMDDGISIDTDNEYLWVHNNDIAYGKPGSDADQKKGDGSLDFKKSQRSTLSYNHFWDSGKCNLLDAGAASTGGSNYISYHHNWYDHSDSRHPRIRNASAVHVYNNYYDGNSKYGVGITCGASAFVEGNYFRDSKNPMMSSKQGTDARAVKGTFSGETGGIIKAYNNFIGNNTKNTLHFVTNKYDYTNNTSSTPALNDIDAYEVDSRSDTVPSTVTTKDGGTAYSNFDTTMNIGVTAAQVEDPQTAKATVMRDAGRHEPDFAWKFDNTTEDTNDTVISELSTALQSYAGLMTKVQGGSASSGSGSGSGSGEGEQGGDAPVAPEPETPASSGAAVISFTKTAASDDRVTRTAAKDYGSVKQTYNGKEYTAGAKLNSSGSVTITLEKEYTVLLVMGTDKTGYTKGLSVDGEVKAPVENVVTVTLAQGSHTVKNGGSETSVFLVILQ